MVRCDPAKGLQRNKKQEAKREKKIAPQNLHSPSYKEASSNLMILGSESRLKYLWVI